MREHKTLIIGEDADARAGFLTSRPDALIVQANPYANISGLADTVEDELAYGIELTEPNREIMCQQIHGISREFGIEHLLERHPLGLSGGQTQLVALASAFLMNRTAMYLENPLVGLDASARKRVIALMKRYAGELMWNNPVRADADERSIATSVLEPETSMTESAGQSRVDWQVSPARLKVQGLDVPHPSSRRGRRSTLNLLSGINMEVSPGESLALIGANGSGKSTLLKTLAGVVKPSAGRVVVGEQDVARRRTRNRPHLISLATQQPRYQILSTSVEREIAAGASVGKDYGHQLLQAFDLERYATENPYDLPTSAQQLLAVVCALASAPSVLALDEPSASLNPADYRRLVKILDSFLGAGGTLVVASHDYEFICDIRARTFTLT